MTKEQWQAHIIETTGAPKPAADPVDFRIKAQAHQAWNPGCPICKDRIKTRKAARSRKIREAVLDSCGLRKGRDSMGRVIWE